MKELEGNEVRRGLLNIEREAVLRCGTGADGKPGALILPIKNQYVQMKRWIFSLLVGPKRPGRITSDVEVRVK